MSEWRKVGQAVVCIDDQYAPPPPGWSGNFDRGWIGRTITGRIYVIREVKWSGGMALFRFVGHRWFNPDGVETWEADWRFRPVVESQTDISELQAILDRLPKREVADA